MPVASGKTDWGKMEINLAGELAYGSITLKIPAFVYVSVSSVADLKNAINYSYADGKLRYAYFLMTSDIDLAGVTDFTSMAQASWTSGDWSIKFAGTFNGNGHEIKNWTNNGWNRGLFTAMVSPAIVENVKFTNVAIGQPIGVVAMQAEHGSIIRNVLVEGKIIQAGSGANPLSLVVAKNGATIENCVVICTSAVDFGDTRAGLLAGSKIGGVEANVKNNLVINLSGKSIRMYSSSASVASSTELANETNKLFTSYADYLAAKDSLTQGAWAKELIASIMAERCALSIDSNVLLEGSTLKLNVNLTYVQSIELAGEAPAGVTLDSATGIITGAETLGEGEFNVVVTFITGESKTLTLCTRVNQNITLEEVKHDVRSAGKTLTVDLTQYNITAVTSLTEGASFANGILTMPVASGKTDWGKMEINLVGELAYGSITLKILAFVYVSVASVADLNNMISYAYATGTVIKDNVPQEKYGYFLMTADIDLAGVNFLTASPASWVSGKGWSSAFAGTFDGNGHTIKNWTLSSGDKGLFVYVISPAVVKDLRIVNASVGGNTGLIATEAILGSRFENILVEGKITNGGSGNNPVSLMIAKNGATIKQCVVICSSSVDVSNARAGLVAGRTVGGVVTEVANNLVINLSNQTALKIYDKGGVNVSSSTELASETNKLFTSYADYLAAKDSLTQGAWAKELIASIIAERCLVKETRTELLEDSSITLNLPYDYVQSIALEGEIPAGVTLDAATGVLTAAAGAGAGTFNVIVTLKSGAVETLTFNTIVNQNVTLADVNHDVRSAGKTLTVDLSYYGITEVTSITEGATLSNGILTMPVATGKSDWGNKEIDLVAKTRYGNLTLKIPAFIYVSVASVSDLNNMMNYAYSETASSVTSKYGYFVMTSSINLANSGFVTACASQWVSGVGWGTRFTGTFDGQGFELQNWTLTTGDCGLFKSLGSGAVVKNVKILNAAVKGPSVGLVSSYAYNGSTIKNVIIEGKFIGTGSGSNPVSLVVAKNGCTMMDCVVICTGAVDFGSTYAGLLAGSKIGGVEANVKNNLVINLSGVKLSMYNNGAVSAGTELAASSNKLYTSYEAFAAAKDSITQDDWASDFLTKYFAN